MNAPVRRCDGCGIPRSKHKGAWYQFGFSMRVWRTADWCSKCHDDGTMQRYSRSSIHTWKEKK